MNDRLFQHRAELGLPAEDPAEDEQIWTEYVSTRLFNRVVKDYE